MAHLSATSATLFYFAVLWCFFWSFRASRSYGMLAVMIAVAALQWLLAGSGFYHVATGLPPRQMLAAAPSIVAVLLTLLLPAGRRWLRTCGLVPLVMLSVLRIPVELVLHEGYLSGLVPRGVTYSGHNFDLFSGISAAFLAAWLLSRRPPPRGVLIAWNIVCLALLAIVVVTAVGSIPSAAQQWNFDQPMVLVLDTPYILLPSLLVPVVLWSHAALLVKLLGPPGPVAGRA